MTINVEAIKEANLIEEVIQESGFTLRGGRRYLKAKEHDSLVVDVDAQLYNWNSKGQAGDVITWLENEKKMDFRQAAEWLARRVGLPMDWRDQDMRAWKATRAVEDTLSLVVKFWQGKLAASSAAASWYEARGWSKELVEEAGCGFWDGDRKGLTDHLKMHQVDVKQNLVQACLSMPTGMFVYVHWVAGRPRYFSARSIKEKRHWKPEVDLMGDQQLYFNTVYSGRARHVVIVEGQADALTLALWGIAAVALAGVYASPQLVKLLAREQRQLYVALDRDAAGDANIAKLAGQLGVMTRVVHWPGGDDVKDANDWLQSGATDKECRECLADSGTFVEWLAEQVDRVEPLDQEVAKRRAIEAMATMPAYAFEEKKKDLARIMSLTQTVLSKMVRELKKEEDAKKKKASDIKKEIIAPNGYLDGHMFEMVYDADHEDGPRTRLAVRYPDGAVKVVNSFETDSYRVMAPDPWDTLLQNKVLRLATEPMDYGDEVALQERIQAFVHRYLDLPESFEVLSSYYVMLSWMFDLFYVLPYLRARGMSDSGKSRFISVIGHLCFRACFVTGSTTPSPVFRKIQEWNGLTLVMDEADLPHSETSAEWIQMFNVGYKKEFAILRTAMTPNGAIVEAFSAFGPKILNMRGKFADDATESRCLTWETSAGRAIRKDIPRYIVDMNAFHAEAQTIRNMCLKWRLERWREIKIDYNHEGTLHMPGRLVEITVPLMSITDSQQFKAKLMEHIEEMSRQAIVDRSSTLGAKVFEAVLRAKHLPDEKALEQPDELLLQVAHITRQANRLIDHENAEALAEGEEAEHKKRLSSGYVGKLLNNDLNLKTDKATIGTRPKVVEWDMDRVNALVIRFGLEDVLVDLVEKGEKAAAERRAKEEAEAKKEAQQGRIEL